MERPTTTAARARDRQSRSLAPFRRTLLIAAAGYAVVGLFALVYLLVRSGWLHVTQPSAVTIAALAVAPLALALLWDRLSAVKAFGVEISLTSASIRMDTEVIGALANEPHYSTDQAMVEAINQAIVQPEQELLNVNLRDGRYWWSTRLFLLAALAEDYSRVQQLVFMEQGGARIFVGMAPPSDIRRALARQWPTLEQSYQEIKSNPPDPPDWPDASLIARIVYGWTPHGFYRDSAAVSEEELKEKVNPSSLHKWLLAMGKRLTTESVDWHGISRPYIVRSLLFEFDSPYVALLRHRQLDRVVNRLDLALRVARRALR